MTHSPAITTFLRQVTGDASGGVVGLLTNIPLFKAAFEEAAHTTYQEEGADVVQSSILNFVGGAVTVTDIGGVATVTITGGAVDWQEEGAAVVTAGTFNVVGAGATLTDVAGVATLTIPGEIEFEEEGGAVVTSRVLNATGAGATLTNVAGVATLNVPGELPTLMVTDEKANNTHGGASLAATQNVRNLNTVEKNTITGASLAANQVTLPAGDYHIRGWTTAFEVVRCKARLRDTTGPATLVVGMSSYSINVNGDSFNIPIEGFFTLGVESDLELQLYTQLAVATFGLGAATNSGDVEIYSMLIFTKLD